MELSFADLFAFGIALLGLSVSLLTQCGGKSNAKKPAQSSKSSSKRSSKSSKSAKGGSKDSSRSNKSKKDSVKPKKAVRNPSASEKDLKSAPVKVETAEVKKEKSVSIRKAEQSVKSAKEVETNKDTKTGVEIRQEETSPQSVGQPAKQAEEGSSVRKEEHSAKTAKEAKSVKQNEVEFAPSEYAMQTDGQAAKNTDEVSLKSIQETQKTMKSQKATGLEAANNNAPLQLQMEPHELRFSDQGGLLKVQLYNPTNTRQAIKAKCSDNSMFRVNPVYGYVEPGQTLNVEVVRQSGGVSKLDKLVFVTAKAPAENTDVKTLFKTAQKDGAVLMVLPLIA